MPQYAAHRMMKVLESHGYRCVRKRGSHMIFKNPFGVMVSLPFHGKNKNIPLGTALAIIRASGIPREQF